MKKKRQLEMNKTEEIMYTAVDATHSTVYAAWDAALSAAYAGLVTATEEARAANNKNNLPGA